MALSFGPVRDLDTGHAISPVVAAALCMKPRGQLTPRQAKKVDALKQGSDAFAERRSLAMRFKGILRSSNRDFWTRGSMTRSTPNSFRSCGSHVFCAETSMPSTTPSSYPGATGRQKVRSTASRPSARNVRPGRPPIAEDTNDATAPPKLRKTPISCQATSPHARSRRSARRFPSRPIRDYPQARGSAQTDRPDASPHAGRSRPS